VVSGSTEYLAASTPKGSTVTLYREDCRTGLPKRLAPKSADVVVTSPPYNLGVRYASYEDRQPRDEYLRWIGAVARSVDRVLSPGGSFFLNVGGPPKDPWLPWDVAREVRRRLVLQNVIHWVKSIAIERSHAGRLSGLSRDVAVGHYKPIGSDRFLHGSHEYIFHFTHRGDVPLDRLSIGVPYQDKSNIRRWARSGGDVRCRGNTWFLPYRTIRRRATDRPHPASFPPELPEQCLKLHGMDRVKLAVDPFLGIGASAVASARLGVPFVGFELDDGYLSESVARLRREGLIAAETVASGTPDPSAGLERRPRVK
jgi:site-specific DNA-methyltransferase (adenine-specific)